MVKLFEMVCTGNNGRSPIAEAIGRDYLLSLGLGLNKYDTISSGTIVDHIKSGAETPMKNMLPIIDIATEREDVFDVRETAKLESAIARQDTTAVNKYFNRVVKLFMSEEREYRDQAVKEFGIQSSIKEGSDQTIARPDTLAVFGMELRHVEEIINIYRGNPKYTPIISGVVCSPNGEVKNSFGKGKERYFANVEQLRKEVPEAIGDVVVFKKFG